MAAVLVAYDGSDLAAYAIERAGRELAPGREAIVVCVWHPADVGFTPVDGRPPVRQRRRRHGDPLRGGRPGGAPPRLNGAVTPSGRRSAR